MAGRTAGDDGRRSGDRGRKPGSSSKPRQTGSKARKGTPSRQSAPSRSGSPTPAKRSAPDRAAERSRPQRSPAPPLDDDIDPRDLDRGVRAALRSLPDSLAETVARHLIAAGRLLEDDPQNALAHAQYARRLAPRLAVVREAAGVAAYHAGDYAAALTELRAVRRMTGDPSFLPMMADAERGLGRPERALTLARDPDVRRLSPADRVEMSIVASGARRDRGETGAAVVVLQGPDLDRTELAPWSVRLWYAYAAALEDDGRADDARRWFASVVAIDDEDQTDAADRLAALGG
jgi:tetratricopeptide (TPR) repeat protein